MPKEHPQTYLFSSRGVSVWTGLPHDDALRESLHYARENGSASYMCFLDGKQAFDHVWHDGPFFKLIEYGIDSTTMLALRNMYSNSLIR